MRISGLVAALVLGVCSAVAEPGFTIRLDVDLDGVKGGERLYEIPGCLTLDLRMAGEDPKLKAYDMRDGNYLPFRRTDGTCPVLEAHMPGVMASRVGLPLGFLGGTGGVLRVVLNYAKTHVSIAVDGRMDDDMLLQPCPPADPAKAKVLSARVKKADFASPADPDAMPLVKDARPIAGSVQYWTPADHNAWVGDVALGFFKGRLHVFYLYDRRHHASKAWKGGHFFAHISSADLVHWEEHPHAVPIENWWETLGTGTPFEYGGKLHLAYGLHTSRCTKDPRYPMGATYAVSEDGIHFTKSGRIIHETQNPTIYNRPDGTLGLVAGYHGMRGFWTSRDLDNWKVYDDKVPTNGDCPCPFEWNGHHYLFQGFNQFAYSPSGKPGTYVDWTKNGLAPYEGLSVPMVAPFTGNRRILAGWLSHRDGWGGWLVFRELIQYPDGTLGQKWVPEIAPPVAPQTFTAQPGEPFRLVFRPASGTGSALVFEIDPAAREAAFRDDVPEVKWSVANRAENFKIRRLPTFASPYAVRVVSYYDRKSEDTIFDVEIGGARTMICRRKGRFRAPEAGVASDVASSKEKVDPE